MKIPAVNVLVVVHPDSACGSADFNLGIREADVARGTLIDDLNAWTGPVVVLAGMFADELSLESYANLRRALDDVLTRAEANGHMAIRAQAPDPDQMKAIREIARREQWRPEQVSLEVTGAWTNRHDDYGCVNSVVRTLRTLGLTAAIRPSAVTEAESRAISASPASGISALKKRRLSL